MKNKKILLAMIALVLVAGVLAAAYYFTRPKTQARQDLHRHCGPQRRHRKGIHLHL